MGKSNHIFLFMSLCLYFCLSIFVHSLFIWIWISSPLSFLLSLPLPHLYYFFCPSFFTTAILSYLLPSASQCYKFLSLSLSLSLSLPFSLALPLFLSPFSSLHAFPPCRFNHLYHSILVEQSCCVHSHTPPSGHVTQSHGPFGTNLGESQSSDETAQM